MARRMQSRVGTATVLALLVLGVFAATSAAQSGVEFADWTSVEQENGTALGQLNGRSIDLIGTLVYDVPASTVDGTSTLFADDAIFAPPVPSGDSLSIGSFNNYSYTFQLAAPVRNPILHIYNLASTLTFTGNPSITKLSGQSTFTVSGGTVTGALDGSSDASGTIQLNGSFSVVQFVTNPVYTAPTVDGVYVTFGAPTTTGPPPPPPPAPTNIVPPQVERVGDGSYRCKPGEWRDTIGSFSYKWQIYRDPYATSELASGQEYTPAESVFGYPIVCVETTFGPYGSVSVPSAQSYFSAAGSNPLPPAYGDVRIRGIDVFDTVQPNSLARMYGYSPDLSFRGFCGGGTPTSWQRGLAACTLGTRDPQSVNYQGVTLDRYKRATAVVYVDMANTDAGDPSLTYNLELSATRGGTSLGEPVVAKVKNPPRSTSSWVQLFERDDDFTGPDRKGIPITLPSAWTSPGGSIRLTAKLKFPDRVYGTSTFGTRQCDVPGCDANDTFTLNDIPFQDYPQLILAPLELRRAAGGQGQLNSAATVLARIRDIYPGGSRIVVPGFRADLDITAATDNTQAVAVPSTSNSICQNAAGTYGTAGPAVTTRSCRTDAVSAIIENWITDNPGRIVGTGGIYVARQYDVVFGVHEYPDGGGGNEPGWTVGSILTDSRLQPTRVANTPYFTATDNTRPLTAAGHELGHVLTAPHAGENCPVPVGQPGNLTGPGNGGNTGEVWQTDNIGRLQSTKFVRRSRLGGPTRYRATVDGPFALPGGTMTGSNLVDIMSYCANLADTASADGNSWVSARNWNRYSVELGRLSRRLATGGLAAAAARATARGPSYAIGVAGPAGGNIVRVVPPDGDDGVPASDPASIYRLRSLNSAGKVLLDAGVDPRVSTSHDGHNSGAFAGPVARGAAALELRRGGDLLDRVKRSRAPRVRLLAPRRHTRVRGRGKLAVSWRATDPDHDRLSATIDFSADNGRNWRTVYDAPSRGRAVIPGRELPASKHARLRVSVNDGFTERTATSRPFVTQGVAPSVQILAPLSDDPVRSGERTLLVGTAFDDIGRAIEGKHLTWLAGRKRLGRGGQIRAKLPAGTRRLRLVARDSHGRAGTATVRLRVTAPALRIVGLSVPLRVGKKARSVTIRMRPSAPATLTAAGKRYRVPAKRTKVTIRLPKKPKVGVLSIPFRLSARGGKATGTVRGKFTVLRT